MTLGLTGDLQELIAADAPMRLGNMLPGFDALALADMARIVKGRCVFIGGDERRVEDMARALRFFAPDVAVLVFPAWDCLPYDRQSPQTALCAQRMAVLSALARYENTPHIVVTSVGAMMQYLPPRVALDNLVQNLRPGQTVDIEALAGFLTSNGYARVSSVIAHGDYAIRGGIIDVFPPGDDAPARLDMFGDTLESLRRFDPDTQRTTAQINELNLVAASELQLDSAAVERFRANYRAHFDIAPSGDPLYDAVSNGTRYQGMEHYLPLFYDAPETAFAHFDAGGEVLYVVDHQADVASESRAQLVEDYYQARVEAREHAKQSKQWAMPPLPLARFYLDHKALQARLAERKRRDISPFALPEGDAGINFDARVARNFTTARAQPEIELFAEVATYIKARQRAGRRVVLACWSEGARARLTRLLEEHGAPPIEKYDDWQTASKGAAVAAIVLGLQAGFETESVSVLSEADILGDRLTRPRRQRRAANVIAEATSLKPGDYVVHIDHGIGRFEGLQTVDAAGAAHDCLRLAYLDDARLYLPVENIELLSRYGGDDADVRLDRLGGAGWQNRRARLKQRLRDMADALIKTAAARVTRDAEKYVPEPSAYEAFCVRFAFDETDDQFAAIESVLDDLASGRPMDRLVCGDVGFGKTEVALRASFVAAMAGAQVALIAPTTLLANQHARSFAERFRDFPLRIAELSRLVAPKRAQEIRDALADGQIDIVIGTHALLAKSVRFKRLGLLIVDEEQHFGVAHKEQLKSLRTQVHILTLTATPIPRTLQMALSGVRDLSLIATPPIDRLAVRTHIAPFDEVTIRAALMREKYRGGQCFITVPRIADLNPLAEFLTAFVPEISFVIANGQMPPRLLETRIRGFYDGQYDALLSTSIIESGLDIPTANTIIVHRADRFGLAQLYQLRGRVGRAKQRAYAYFTYDPDKPLTESAENRLKIMQSLSGLGAGFTLASHDLDTRGAGNLLGEEQSGQIREVGFELYQSMLEEAIAEAQGETREAVWSPQINIGASVLIPEHYVADFDIRMGLYRRLAEMETRAEIDAIAAEMIDRFGALPQEVGYLLDVIWIKSLCRRANIEQLDAGAKGATLRFRNNEFAHPEGLVAFITEQGRRVKLRADHSLVVRGDWEDTTTRYRGVRDFVQALAECADQVD